jgi:CheY-like chemotaxis protein
MLEFIADHLSENYQVLKRGNYVQALEILYTESIQLVVTDVMMDVMDGFELCKAIKTGFNSIHTCDPATAKFLQSKIEGLELELMRISKSPFLPNT